MVKCLIVVRDGFWVSLLVFLCFLVLFETVPLLIIYLGLTMFIVPVIKGKNINLRIHFICVKIFSCDGLILVLK